MRRTWLVVVAVVAIPGACAIQPDSSPRDVPVGERALLDPVDPPAGDSEGSSRVFLLNSGEDDGERSLRSALRDVADPTPKAVLEELILGPNQQELDLGLQTALPADLLVDSARLAAGTLNVDVSAEILDLPGSALGLAVAAIVFTASELPGVRAVRLRVDGEIREWPDGRGELQNDPLTVFDFPGVAESTQPPYPAVPTVA